MLVWVWCIRRCGLARFERIFEFMDRHEGKIVRMPAYIRAELKAHRDLVGLAMADVGAPLQRIVWCADAEGGEKE